MSRLRNAAARAPLAAVLLLTFLVAVPGHAVSLRLAEGAFAPWHWLASAWGRVAGLWAEQGVEIDPHGQPAAGPPPTSVLALQDEGRATVDPWGRPAPGPTSDEGVDIDPTGKR